MKQFIKSANYLLGYARRLIFLVGLCLVAIFAMLGIAYLRGELVGEIKPDFTAAITGADGMLAYYWVGLLGTWVVLEIIHWAAKARGWWLHRDRIKADILKDGARLKKLLSGAD